MDRKRKKEKKEKKKKEKKRKKKRKNKRWEKKEKKIRSFFKRNKAGETWSWKIFIFERTQILLKRKFYLLLRISWTSFNNPNHLIIYLEKLLIK